jgi:hypothetical protein
VAVHSRSLSFLIVVTILIPIIGAESALELGEVVHLEDSDIGLLGATIDSQNEQVLAYGKNSKIIIINPVNPEDNFDITWNSGFNLSDADYHPSGNTAIIVGESGLVLRYSKETGNVQRVGNFVQFNNDNLESISWNADGSWAYIGSEEGNIWKFRGGIGNSSEVQLISDRILSKVTSIDCHQDVNICIVSTISEGIGIIDDSHRINWIGGTNYPWVDINCPDGNSCIAISSENNLGAIGLNLDKPFESSLKVTYLDNIFGKLICVEHQNKNVNLISLVPFSLIEFNSTTGDAFSGIEYKDVKEFSASISDEIIISTWGIDKDGGWILTSQGTAIKYDQIILNSNSSLLDFLVILSFLVIILGITYSRRIKK